MRTKSLVEGYARWRAADGKPGPAKWTGGRPRKNKPRRVILTAAPEERRQYLLKALQKQEAAPMAEEEWMNSPQMREIISKVVAYKRDQAARAEQERQRKPRLAVNNGEAAPQPSVQAPASTQLTLVHDADALARDVTAIGQLAMARIKETLAKPFDPADPNYAALLRFTSGAFNTAMNTMLRADENLLRARVVDRLPELLERVAEEERKRCERRHSVDPAPDGAA
jgi:hypothetical protein